MAKDFTKTEEKKETIQRPYWVIFNTKKKSIWAGGNVTYFDTYEAAAVELKLQESRLPADKKDHGYVIERKMGFGTAPAGPRPKEVRMPYNG